VRVVPLGTLLCLTLFAADSFKKPGERQRAPDFELNDAAGSEVRLSTYNGKVVLLDFWATWCIPCKTQIPWFVEFEQKYKDQGFAVLGISMDKGGWTTVKPYIERVGINYRIVLGDTRTQYKYGDLDSLPVSFLIDREQRVAAIHIGLASKKRVEDQIRKLLTE
jgi:peroxiredoxin